MKKNDFFDYSNYSKIQYINIEKASHEIEKKLDISRTTFYRFIRHHDDFKVLLKKIGSYPKINVQDLNEFISKVDQGLIQINVD
jgi:hypothetical protein